MRALFLHTCLVLTAVLLAVSGARGQSPNPNAFVHPLTGYEFTFPRDFFAHNGYQVEWWYVTGNLADPSGRRYGYQCSFFRVSLEGLRALEPYRKTPSRWSDDQIYFAHMAVADLDGEAFYFFERINRQGLGMAGAAEDKLEVWNENWKLTGDGETRRLTAKEAGTGFDLKLTPLKNPVIHGAGEDRPKWDLPAQAPNYYSLTRMKTEGTVTIKGRSYSVTGTSWMDHVFASQVLVPKQAGWDWFVLQLDNQAEIMLLMIRMQDGSYDPRSGGTIVHPDGTHAHLSFEQLQVQVDKKWTSPKSGVTYPAGWTVTLPGHDVKLKISPGMANQELFLLRSIANSYWEGSVSIEGTFQGRPVGGKGYVELVGYGGSLADSFPE